MSVNVIPPVILVQQPDPRQRSMIATVFDNAFENGRPHSHAVVTRDRVAREHIISAAYSMDDYAPATAGTFCSESGLAPKNFMTVPPCLLDMDRLSSS